MTLKKVVTIFAFVLLIGCSSQESKNQEVSQEVLDKIGESLENSDKNDEIVKTLQKLMDNKNYTDVMKTFQQKYNEVTDEEQKTTAKNLYKESIVQLLEHDNLVIVEKLLESPNAHKEVLSTDILDRIKSDREGMETAHKESASAENVDRILELLDSKDYMTIYQYDNDEATETVRTLIKYARALDHLAVMKDTQDIWFKRYIGWIDPKYNGVRSKEIIAFANKYLTKDEWQQLYAEERKWDQRFARANARSEQEKKNQASKPLPTIGMTTDEVLNSQWGEPEDINKTITAYGTDEQWVYPNFKYLYFEDGILVTIQE
ncbi:DUF2845 domain-containing protein [Fictibacillus phosphorivorans]|uniref:DUF2845 domain-containing protein n=1 Tax=Fictibacillus phosphorivorans TaxID=1221500 RepID=UPI00203AFE30|nr:DUF2845 domain-containing protein [Fictibacillus phosphorivorans]MCM3719181.1 DUF2845 domain-containing protein [Fictibacillus phosphorivorans]MCM3776803.1 DUF2845 domain-containing protein [Fictibacillus phosphorivorans]